MRSWGNSYSEAVSQGGPYSPIDAKNYDSYSASGYVDDALDGTPGALVPAAVAGKSRLVLDYRPIRSTLSITLGGVPASLVEWGSTVSAGVVGVNYNTGELDFSPSDSASLVVCTYQHYGTVIDAHAFNRLQYAVDSASGNSHVQNTDTGTTQSSFRINQDASASSGTLRFGQSGLWGTSGWLSYTSSGGPIDEFGFASDGGATVRVTADQFSGSGALLTALNASNISSGTVPAARLPSEIAYTDDNVSFDGNLYADGDIETDGGFIGNGAGITGLNASSLGSGTVPVARLPSTVARRDQANTFTQANTFNGVIKPPTVLYANSSNINHTLSSTDTVLCLGNNDPGSTINVNMGVPQVGREIRLINTGELQNTPVFTCPSGVLFTWSGGGFTTTYNGPTADHACVIIYGENATRWRVIPVT